MGVRSAFPASARHRHVREVLRLAQPGNSENRMVRQMVVRTFVALLFVAGSIPASAYDRCAGRWTGNVTNTTVQVRSTMSLAFNASGDGGSIVIEPPLSGSSKFSIANGPNDIMVLRTRAPKIEWQVLECDGKRGVLRGRYKVLERAGPYLTQEGEFELGPAVFTPKF